MILVNGQNRKLIQSLLKPDFVEVNGILTHSGQDAESDKKY
jgi:hypothetical protein